jgi:single-strand DNA-binding protein
MNTATFAGRLGGDAELRYTKAQDAVCGFTLAVDVYRKGGNETLWIKCALWGARGERLVEYLTKGLPVCVTGSVGVEAYTDKQGEAKASLKLDVRELTMLGSKSDRAEAQPARQQQRQAPEPEQPGFEEDDIPF